MKKTTKIRPAYEINSSGEFVIENYNFSKPFADFFPGIAGKYGIPMWVFFVNRGQAVSSFGIRDKDHAILEFWPANKAWQLVASHGFRTFIKVSSGAQRSFYEPFHNGCINQPYALSNRMRIRPHDLTIEEENGSLGLAVKIDYFNIPLDTYAGLCRIVEIRNTGRARRTLQVIDGLPQLVPYGTNDFFLKKMSRTIEAWMTVENLAKNAPFFKLSVDPGDRPEVVHIDQGYFYLGFKPAGGLIKPILDPAALFKPAMDFSYPLAFASAADFKAPRREQLSSKTPCAFLPLDHVLKPGETLTLCVIAGYSRTVATLNALLPRVTKLSYLKEKQAQNRVLIEGITGDMRTSSSSRTFDLYARQTYLDNVLRGGYPVTFGKKTVFHLYSRKHGDLERDYNAFSIQPAYFSQGNGNYRDANQNRRSDVWFNPRIGDENVLHFLNLLQLDGFNPLIVKGSSFQLMDESGLRKSLPALLTEDEIGKLLNFLKKPFTPGDVVFFLQDNRMSCASYDEFLALLMNHSSKIYDAEHGEGFWTDHWTYNLDLIENYLAVYPEKTRELFFEKRAFTFFDNTEVVRPRSEKYVLYDGKPRQLHAVHVDHAKREMIHKRAQRPNVVRSNRGAGDVYETTLVNKLFCLFANKLASLDPSGIGIEMESNKPNWFDALNGLPALFGSSVCETFEVKRLAGMLKAAIQLNRIENISLSEEVCVLVRGLHALLRDNPSAGPAPALETVAQDDSRFIYWDRSAALKEKYRETTKLGVSGKEEIMRAEELVGLLDAAEAKLSAGIAAARGASEDIYSSYFRHEVVSYDALGEGRIRPTVFARRKLPLFLEGQVHALRVAADADEARSLCRAAKASALYDRALKMYKVTASLKSEPEEIGRCRIFPPGWLENESIWLHMEYKYLLEILKQGLTDEFYAEFKNILIPFQNPARYGRSILQNSSFIVSSAFPDAQLHGNGFVARLSGSTAEFLQMWLIMNAGARPFLLDAKGELTVRFSPSLAGWLFDPAAKTYSFRFLGTTDVVYHNPKRKNTYGKDKAVPRSITLTDAAGVTVNVASDTIPAPHAESLRAGGIKRIDILLE